MQKEASTEERLSLDDLSSGIISVSLEYADCSDPEELLALRERLEGFLDAYYTEIDSGRSPPKKSPPPSKKLPPQSSKTLKVWKGTPLIQGKPKPDLMVVVAAETSARAMAIMETALKYKVPSKHFKELYSEATTSDLPSGTRDEGVWVTRLTEDPRFKGRFDKLT